MRTSKALIACALGLGATLSSATGNAHGVWGHVQVTAWAIDNLPPGELRTFFEDPEVFNAALYGAAFTDSGYTFGQLPAPDPESQRRGSAYSEHTHWEPFIQQFIDWMGEFDAPPYTSQESKKRVAFLLGCAAHGLQDEIFDSLFLLQTREHDHAGQDEADPASDGFLGVDGHARFVPEPYVPMDTLLELYQGAGLDTSKEIMEEGMRILGLYLNETSGPIVHQSLAERFEERVPWTRAHYMDPDIPGSLRSEILPTGFYLTAIWDRLHGQNTPDSLVVYTYPDPPRRLIGHQAGSPDSWVTFVVGRGVDSGSFEAEWTTEDGSPVPFTSGGTRWGAGWSRLIRLYPEEDLEPGGWYTAGLQAGAPLIDGQTLSQEFSVDFQAACLPENSSDCEDLGDLPVPRIDADGPPGADDPPGTDDPPDDPPPPENSDTTAPPEDSSAGSNPPSRATPPDSGAEPESGQASSGCTVTHPQAPTQSLYGFIAWGLAIVIARARRKPCR